MFQYARQSMIWILLACAYAEALAQPTVAEPAGNDAAVENETPSNADAESSSAASDDAPAADNTPAEADELKMAEPPEDIEEAVSTIWKSLSTMWEDFLRRLPLFVVAVLVMIVTWGIANLVNRLVRRLLRRVHIRGSLKDLLRQFAYCAVWLVGLMAAAVVIFPGMTPAKVLTVLGLSSIAVGFAFKDIVENFFAGVLILWGYPFETGDFIECNDIKGKVEDTTIRMTTIRQVDGQLVVMPNAQLFKSPVHVLTDQRLRRTTIIAGVGYGEDVDHCREVITKAVEACESVSKDKPIQIFAQEFGASSINYEVTWWAGSTPVAERKSRDEVVAAVKRALDNAGVEIPFPYRTLTFREPLQVLHQAQ